MSGGDFKQRNAKVPDLPERILMDISGRCNLRCPMCLVHGLEDDDLRESAIGYMDYDGARKILDEVMEAKTLIQPNMWGEPTLTPKFREHISEMKKRGLAVAINTNGLTLNERLAGFLVDAEVDSLFFSIDATTPETLMKVRGVDKLVKIARNIEGALKVGGDRTLPRIGATFTFQAEN